MGNESAWLTSVWTAFPSFLILNKPHTIEQMIRHFLVSGCKANIAKSLIRPRGNTSKESAIVMMMTPINQFVIQ